LLGQRLGRGCIWSLLSLRFHFDFHSSAPTGRTDLLLSSLVMEAVY
jgi:hypothetical protein